jgi:hypothetical protein
MTGVHSSIKWILGASALALLMALAGASPASAASPWWHLTSGSRPSTIQPGGRGQIVITAANLGDEAANGESSVVSITDALPAGVKVVPCPKEKQKPGCGIEGLAGEPEGLSGNRGPVRCPTKAPLPQTLTCTFGGTYLREGIVVPESLPPFDQIEILIEVEAEEEPVSGEVNEVNVSGGHAPDASIKRPLQIGGEEAFGVESWELTAEEEGGAPATQAGSHPFQVTGTVTIDQTAQAEPVVLTKELNGELPPGLIGNPSPLAQCTLGQFLTITGFVENQCPQPTAVGVAMVTVNERSNLGVTTFTVPIFNIEPSVGEPARFGFYLPGTPVLLDPSVRTGGDYGITLGSTNITQTAALLSIKTIFWGVPGDPRHDNARGIRCFEAAREELPVSECHLQEAHNPSPFLSMPTSCTGPLVTNIEAASWKEPRNRLVFPGGPMPAMDGCNRLSFTPSIKVAPDGSSASTPTGLSVDVHVPQDAVLVANGLAESNVRAISVTLPEGVTLNPAAADGLQACSEGQIGYLPGESNPPSELAFTPTLPDPLQQGLNFCPDAAKVGTVRIVSPLLPAGQPLEGAVYLATPAPEGEEGNNPFRTTVAMYIVARDPKSGTLVKLPGSVTLDQQTGQISSTFENTPQLAFEDAEIHFFGGERAPLVTPARCGAYTTQATFTPWSGNAPVKSTSSFEVRTGPNGTPCPGTLPFSPVLAAGSPNINAGGFSPLTTTITRQDGNQSIQTVQLQMAPGMSGILAGVPLCPEVQANAGTCGPESLIGETIVSVGLGGDPFTVTGGKVYLTEKYQGAPFGLSIVNPADAGPFHLGKVVVRARIEVDPYTAALTITTGEIPHIIKGFPLQIKHVNVLINRSGFTFNPTNCNPMSITGTIGSVDGASSPVSIPFQVTNCASLKFTPKFSVSTGAHTSKANGASLTATLTEPNEPRGNQANIAKVKVELPKQLPSRLTTLQKACTNAQFEANPAGCPPESDIGHAKVITPLLPVPLEGPAIFVSHGGEAFPSLTMVLQGYGVTVDLVGTTFISKTGVTSTTFKTVPDTPFNTFELILPTGKFSALTALGNVCTRSLIMPTEFVAQNGMILKQNTKVGVTGCPKKKTPTRAQKLALALRACHKKSKAKRAACERQARRKYRRKPA